MTFRQLFYLVEVSKHNSINKAAQKLYISQSTISSSIRELEEYLGIKILRRTNRGIEFTKQGNEFLYYAKTLLLQKQHIEGDLSKKSSPDSGHLFNHRLAEVHIRIKCSCRRCNALG